MSEGRGWDGPWATWSAWAYPAAAGLLVLTQRQDATAAVFAAAMLLLGVGTWAFHWDRGPATVDLDHAGMNAAVGALALAATGAPWPVVALGAAVMAVVLEYVLDARNVQVVGVCVLAGVGAAAGAGAWWMGASAVGVLGLGYWAWHYDGDAPHAYWHAATAVGLCLLFLAATGGG